MEPNKALSDEFREELEGFIEFWKENASSFRGSAEERERGMAEVYDECADELESLLKRG